jgi:RND family efflux transporter MFP subunit
MRIRGIHGKADAPALMHVLFLSMLIHVVAVSAINGATVRSEGIVEPIEDVILRSTVPGTIERYVFEEGDPVQAQEVVLILENRLQQLEMARRKLIWESKVELQAAEAKLELAQKDLDATRKLYETTQSVSREELDTKMVEAQLAQAEVDRIKVEEEREKIEHDISVEQYQLRLLKSPITGVVTKRYMDAGETTEGQEPLVRIVDLSRCVFVANVDASLIGRLHVGQSVDIFVQGGEEITVQGAAVVFVSPVVDPSSGLQEVKAEFPNPGQRIRAGLTGQMAFDPDVAPETETGSDQSTQDESPDSEQVPSGL